MNAKKRNKYDKQNRSAELYKLLIEHEAWCRRRKQKALEEGGYMCSRAPARGDTGDVFRAAAHL